MADKKGTFADEIDNRLGDFFGDTDKSDVPARDTNLAPQENSELFDLQSIVLSVEWEISDEIMARLIAETDRLIKIYRDNQVAHSLLKLLDSVGRYINAKKATSHPDSIKLLHSIHANLQQVVTSKTITDDQSRKILATEIAKFKNLKQLLLTKAEPPPIIEKKPPARIKAAPIQPTPPLEPPKPPAQAKGASTAAAADGNLDQSNDAVIQAINELKMLITKEFNSLREELKQQRR